MPLGMMSIATKAWNTCIDQRCVGTMVIYITEAFILSQWPTITDGTVAYGL